MSASSYVAWVLEVVADLDRLMQHRPMLRDCVVVPGSNRPQSRTMGHLCVVDGSSHRPPHTARRGLDIGDMTFRTVVDRAQERYPSRAARTEFYGVYTSRNYVWRVFSWLGTLQVPALTCFLVIDE